jgi:hypothetical protein
MEFVLAKYVYHIYLEDLMHMFKWFRQNIATFLMSSLFLLTAAQVMAQQSAVLENRAL